MNGEIYNHRDLRRQLERRGHRFKTQAENRMDCLDLLPAFKQSARKELYLEYDDHLNEAGKSIGL